jgi:hypothetical protein
MSGQLRRSVHNELGKNEARPGANPPGFGAFGSAGTDRGAELILDS